MGEGLEDRPLTTRTLHLCVDMQNLFAPGGPWAASWMAVE